MSSSVLADPKVLVLIAGVVLTVIAFGTLHEFSAVLALALIVIAGFAILWRGIKLKLKLAGLVVGLLIVLISNGIEGWQESKAQEKTEEQIKQQAATEAERKRLQELAFAQLSPQEHLDKARALLKVERVGNHVSEPPQTSIDEALKHLSAIGSSAPEFAKAQQLRQQYEAGQKLQNEENSRTPAQSPGDLSAHPNFRVYRNKPDEGVSVVVPVGTTNEQLKALLWFFRQKVRTGDFRSLGIMKPTAKRYGKFDYLDGMISVYRGEKCANEEYLDSIGPCGYGEHYDALLQWGIDGDPAKDVGTIQLKNGDSMTVFDYEDGWTPKK